MHLTPCTFPSTIQACLSCRTTKEPFLFSVQPMMQRRTGHLPLQRNKMPLWNYPQISYTWQNNDKTYPWNRRRMGTRSSPHSLLCPKWQASLNIISMQGLVWWLYLQQKLFVLLSSSLNCIFLLDGWFHFLHSKGLWNNGSHRHCYKTTARMFVIYLCMPGHAPLLVGIYKNYAGC